MLFVILPVKCENDQAFTHCNRTDYGALNCLLTERCVVSRAGLRLDSSTAGVEGAAFFRPRLIAMRRTVSTNGIWLSAGNIGDHNMDYVPVMYRSRGQPRCGGRS